MRRIFILFISFFISVYFYGQDTIFFDNFENGLSNWTTTGSWGLTTAQSYSPIHSLADSPNGNYTDNSITICSMSQGVSLIHVPSATLSFYATFQIETGFDYLYVDVSKDNFQTYVTVLTLNGENTHLPPFLNYSANIGAFCGFGNVKIRFRLVTDQYYTVDGIYIDNVLITKGAQDVSAPFIVHNPLPFMQGSLNDHVITADIFDYSGVNVSSLELYYSVDGNMYQSISGSHVSGYTYTFTIPAQPAGAHVSYYIYAEDNAYIPNVAFSDTFEYIAGNHIIQDNGQVDYYMKVFAGEGVAVKVHLGNTNLVGLLIRNYTDYQNPNDSMLIHIWDNNNGLPGNDLITPFKVKPSATLQNPQAMTWVDLRPYAPQLSNLNGYYFIGFTVPSGSVNITITQPGMYNASYYYNGNQWFISSGTGGNNDHHFRAITSAAEDLLGPIIVNTTAPVHYEASHTSQQIIAFINDPSGVQLATLYYQVDQNSPLTVSGTHIGNNYWKFTIPAQSFGAWVKYWIIAADQNLPAPNIAVSDTFCYISGTYLKFDNNNPNVYVPVGTLTNNFQAAALRLQFDTMPATITTLLIRNYYSNSNPANTPNNPMKIHVWTDNFGQPGTDLIPPITIPSEASPQNPLAFTRIDLRPYASLLTNLFGTFYIGFTVDSGSCAVLGNNNPMFNRSVVHNGNYWYDYNIDLMIRTIVKFANQTEYENISQNNLDVTIYPNPASDHIFISPNFKQNYSIEILNMMGQPCLSISSAKSIHFLNISHLPSSIYLVKISSLSQHKIFLLRKI
ncbi:MAG: T9SS type A sorting domain-containing protein [Bacteroidales bacterium]|nr:T9SS type A sorting domain-containing protein [Bacteroidales bacterium]